MPLIHVENVVKEFRTPKRQPGLLGGLHTLFTRECTVKRAVDSVSFSVDEGELIGYIGPNGAGKSTTIKMLTGILTPTTGTVEVAGLVPWRRREQNALNIGVVFGQRSQLWWDLPLIESFKLIAKMYRVERARYEANLAHFRELLDLDEFMATPVRQLSLGQRMRGDLAAALLYDPPIVYLDEPTVGLDVLAKEHIRTFIERINRDRRATVILTTHDLGDVERLCRRIILIDQGKVLYDGQIARLKAAYAPHRLLIVQLAADSAGLLSGAPLDVPGAEFVHWSEGKAWLRFDPSHIAAHSLIGALTERYAISDLSIVEPELESVIRQIYQQRQVIV
jgi:ABC-2 type transport system ATP-binding protein